MSTEAPLLERARAVVAAYDELPHPIYDSRLDREVAALRLLVRDIDETRAVLHRLLDAQ